MQYLRMTVIDTLAFWNAPLGDYVFNPNLRKTFTGWYRVPNDWVSDGIVNEERREMLFRHLYGDTWRLGNEDGSKYVVLECAIQVLTPAEAAQRPWMATPTRCYAVTDAGVVTRVDAATL